MSKPSIAAKVVMIGQCLPAKPPCFHSNQAWLEYVIQAESAHKESDAPGRGPFAPGVAGFNPMFDFCADCDKVHAGQMAAQNLCNPLALRGIKPKEVTAQDASAHMALSSLKSMWVLIAHAEKPALVSELVSDPRALAVARRSQKSVMWFCDRLVGRSYLRCSTNKPEIHSSIWWDSSCRVPARCPRPAARVEKREVVA